MNKEKYILLVEDDEAIRFELKEILEMEGHDVKPCENGKEALNFLLSISTENFPSCIILDLMMPVMNGIEFLAELQKEQNKVFQSIPIIVATAKGSPRGELQELPESIIKIHKPFDIDKLLDTVKVFNQ